MGVRVYQSRDNYSIAQIDDATISSGDRLCCLRVRANRQNLVVVRQDRPVGDRSPIDRANPLCSPESELSFMLGRRIVDLNVLNLTFAVSGASRQITRVIVATIVPMVVPGKQVQSVRQLGRLCPKLRIASVGHTCKTAQEELISRSLRQLDQEPFFAPANREAA
jgi:hypothetical protein